MNENEFLIELQARLDEARSKGNINSDIDALQKSIRALQLQAEISPDAIQNIIKQVQSILGKGITISNINIDTKQVSQNAQRAAKEVSTAFKSAMTLDHIFDNQTRSLMKEFGVDGKKAFNEIRAALVNYRQELSSTTVANEDFDDLLDMFAAGSNGIYKVTNAIANNLKVATDANKVYSDLVEHIKKVNTNGSKIHLPSTIKEEYGNMFNSMKKTLGPAFTLKGGTDFEVFLTGLNEKLGNVIDLSKGAEYAFGDLVEKVVSGRGTNFLSGNELFTSGMFDRNEVESKISEYMDLIESEYQKISQISSDTSNTVIKNVKQIQESYKETLNSIKALSSEESIVKSGAGSITFEGNNNAAKEAQRYFKDILQDENVIISTIEKFGDNNALSSFTVNIKRASGEVESLKYTLSELKDDEGNIEDFFFKLSESSIGDAGAKKLVQDIDNAYADYTAKIAQFKNTNKEILSGLSSPISDFESKLAGLKTGSATVDDVRNSFKLLSAEASNITSNFTGQLSKIDAAIRNIAKGEDTLSGLRAEFKGLNNSPKNINSELNRLSESLQKIKDIESTEGRNANWSKTYREWEIAVDSLKAKLIALKKEQSNVASTEIFNISDLRKNDIAYMSKVSNTISKQMAEIKKMAHAKGWTGFDVTGIEEADGKIKALVMTVTDAEGAIKKLNFQRAKLVGNGKVQDGLMQTGDVQILKTAVKAQEELAAKTEKTNAELKKQTNKITKSLSNGDYDKKLKLLISSYEKLGLTSDEVKSKTSEVALALEKLKEKNLDTLIQDENNFATALKKAQNEAAILKTDLDNIYNPKRQTNLSNSIQNWLHKNSNASKDAKESLNEYYRELSNGRVSVNRLEYIEKELKNIDTAQRKLGKLGKNIIDQFADAGRSFGQWLSISSGIMTIVSKSKEAISELKNLDSILTEISKTSDLTNRELKALGDSAFNAASKYGKTASNYLTGVQEMYRAGYNNAQQMSELSILAQAAGDMDATTANDYLIASDAAYNLKGNVEALNAVLDGQNMVTNHAAVSMLDMAQATSEAASIASQYGVEIDELSSLIAVATSKTRESGSETGTALKALFVNLQDTTSKPIRQAFEAVDISMTEMVNGSEKLKTPIRLLKELSDAFVSLGEGDVRRANILSDIGGKHHANTLSAILSDWQSYEKMLDLYSNGMGSAEKEAEKSANNWEGSLARLSNTWTSTVNNIVNSDAIIAGINGLNKILSVIDKITDHLGSIGTIGLGAGFFAGLKNVGEGKKYSSNCYLF